MMVMQLCFQDERNNAKINKQTRVFSKAFYFLFLVLFLLITRRKNLKRCKYGCYSTQRDFIYKIRSYT